MKKIKPAAIVSAAIFLCVFTQDSFAQGGGFFKGGKNLRKILQEAKIKAAPSPSRSANTAQGASALKTAGDAIVKPVPPALLTLAPLHEQAMPLLRQQARYINREVLLGKDVGGNAAFEKYPIFDNNLVKLSDFGRITKDVEPGGVCAFEYRGRTPHQIFGQFESQWLLIPTNLYGVEKYLYTIDKLKGLRAGNVIWDIPEVAGLYLDSVKGQLYVIKKAFPENAVNLEETFLKSIEAIPFSGKVEEDRIIEVFSRMAKERNMTVIRQINDILPVQEFYFYRKGADLYVGMRDLSRIGLINTKDPRMVSRAIAVNKFTAEWLIKYFKDPQFRSPEKLRDYELQNTPQFTEPPAKKPAITEEGNEFEAEYEIELQRELNK